MKCSVGLFRLLLVAFSGLVLAGCMPSLQSQIEEEKEPHFLAGKNRVNTMDYQGAIDSFEKALTVNPKSASAHFELAWLFDQKEPDPAAAVYHYQRYLALRPNAEKAEFVRQHILACKQEVARDVSLVPLTEKQQRDVEKLVEENKRLSLLNKQLTEEAAKWRAVAVSHALEQNNPAPVSPAPATALSTSSPSPAVPHPPVGAASQPPQTPFPPKPLPSPAHPASPPGIAGTAGASPRQSGAHQLPQTNTFQPSSTQTAPPTLAARRNRPASSLPTHTVKVHETMGSIARQYGLRVEALVAANPSVNPRRLQIGQHLIIP